MQITVSTNAAEVSKALRVLFSSQIPHATARSINAAATGFQKEQRTEMADRFTLRRKSWAERSVKIRRGDFANKRKLEAFVRIETPGDTSRSDILIQHEEGDTKRPRGQHIAVPQEGVKRTGKGIIRKGNRPKDFNFQHHGGRVYIGDKRTVMILSPGGGGVILQRQGRKVPKRGRSRENQGAQLASDVRTRSVRDLNMKLLYRFTDQADLDDRLKFVETAQKTAPDAFAKAFPVEFAKAIRTAR